MFEWIDFVFTIVFTVELGITYTAFAVVEYFTDPWRVFDFVIVLFSLVSIMGKRQTPNPKPQTPNRTSGPARCPLLPRLYFFVFLFFSLFFPPLSP